MSVIKKMLMKWLKRQIVKIAIDKECPIPTWSFKWIYNSPINTWRDKLLIVRACGDFAEEYYCWLNSDSTFDIGNCVSTTSPDSK